MDLKFNGEYIVAVGESSGATGCRVLLEMSGWMNFLECHFNLCL